MIRKINGVDLRPFTDATTYTVSSTTSEIKTASILIPGGTFTDGDLLSVEGMFFKTNTNNTFRINLYHNTSDSLTGASAIGSRTSASSSIVYMHFYRRMNVRNDSGLGSGIETGTEVIGTSVNTVNDLQSNGGFTSMSNLAIDWTEDVYIIFAIRPNSGFDTVTQRFAKVWTY